MNLYIHEETNHHPVDQSINQSVSQWTDQPINQPTHQSTNQSVSQSNNHECISDCLGHSHYTIISPDQLPKENSENRLHISWFGPHGLWILFHGKMMYCNVESDKFTIKQIMPSRMVKSACWFVWGMILLIWICRKAVLFMKFIIDVIIWQSRTLFSNLP